MPLFGKDKDKESERTKLKTALSAVADAGLGQDGVFSSDQTLARVLACRARSLAVAAQEDIKAGDNSLEDLASVAETLDSFYAISKKLDEIDQTLINASAKHLTRTLTPYGASAKIGELYYGQRVTDAASWRHESERQAGEIKEWIAAIERPTKRTWFEGLYGVREQVRESLLSSYRHVQDVREDMAFLHTAVNSQHLLPEFAIADARAEMVTTEGEARKARELADHVAALDAPVLGSLEQPQPALETAEPVEDLSLSGH